MIATVSRRLAHKTVPARLARESVITAPPRGQPCAVSVQHLTIILQDRCQSSPLSPHSSNPNASFDPSFCPCCSTPPLQPKDAGCFSGIASVLFGERHDARVREPGYECSLLCRSGHSGRPVLSASSHRDEGQAVISEALAGHLKPC